MANTSRRTLLALAAVAPLARTSQTPHTPGTELQPININGIQIISISPDGSTLVGLAEEEHLVFLDTETLEERSRTKARAEIQVIDTRCIAWNSDASTLAFGVEAWKRFIDSDIFLVDSVTGDMTNATGEGHKNEIDDVDFLKGSTEHYLIDVYPVWLDDSSLLFGRHQKQTSTNNWVSSVSKLNANSGDVTEWAPLNAAGVQFVSSPIYPLRDNRMLFLGQDQDNQALIVVVDSQGLVKIIDTGDIEAPILLDSDGEHILVTDARANDVWQFSLFGTDEPVDAFELFNLSVEEGFFNTYPTYGPEPGSILAVISTPNADVRVLTLTSGEINEIGTVSADSGIRHTAWAESHILVVGDDTAWLHPMD